MKHFDFSIPFNNPVLIFSLMLFIILLAPALFKKIKIPSIVGLIVAGVLIGPNGFNLLLRDSSIELFGTVGLLYIMFIAGLEMDLNDFRKNRNRSLVFGFLTFSIPLTAGIWVSHYVLNFSLSSSILMASMFSTHTLVAYPIASRLGITRNEAVAVAVGGTIITDTAALLLLTVISSFERGELSPFFISKLAVSFLFFVVITMWGIPKISRWFFRSIKGETNQQYIFVLGMVFTAAFLAQLAGVEPIIGAFLAGLALNRLIPHTSPLMNRIEFVGNAIFIPFFLIGIGMLVNFRVFLHGTQGLIITGVLITTAVVTKYLAAFITQKIFRYSLVQRNTIFGLSTAHAAATLAIITIGYNIGLLNEMVLNATIFLILVTCLISSFATESAGRKLAITLSGHSPVSSSMPQRILVSIADAAKVLPLIDLSILIKNPESHEPVYTLSVVKDDEEAQQKIIHHNKMMVSAIKHASNSDINLQVVSRADLNVSNGIISTIRELMITDIVLGWKENISATKMIFGSILDNMLLKTEQMIIVSKIIHNANDFRNIVVAIPPYAELEKGFVRWIRTVCLIAKHTNNTLVFLGNNATLMRVKSMTQEDQNIHGRFRDFDGWSDFSRLAQEMAGGDLLVVITARQRTISYNSYLDQIPQTLMKHFEQASFLIIYPEQYDIRHYDSMLQFDALTPSPIQENIERINKLRKILARMFTGQ